MVCTLILPGGSGYLGRHLAEYFVGRGDRVIILTRSLSPIDSNDAIQYLPWDGQTLGAWAEAFDGAAAVVNLAGRTVNCRYNAKNRREIYESRLRSIAVIGQASHKRIGLPAAKWMLAIGAFALRTETELLLVGSPGTELEFAL